MASWSPTWSLVEDHHEGVLLAACGRWRAPGVMTTTLRANAQELQVSTTVEENARDAPAWTLEQQGRIVPANNRYRAGEASIRSSEEQGRSRHHSAHRGGLELSTGMGLYGVCRSTLQCSMAVWSRWVESSTRLGMCRPSVVWLCVVYMGGVHYAPRWL